jgi:DNA-binding NarL/FixJ family response regulator
VPAGDHHDPVGIVVIDDRQLARIAARAILQEVADFKWLGEAASADEAVALVARLKPDIVLLDVEMPETDGPETARRLLSVRPGLVILAWTVSDSGDDLLRMFQAGCVGYALKDFGPTELVTAIRVALRRETVVPRRMLGEVLRQAADHVPDPDAAQVTLTPTENTILKLLAKGYASKQIAVQLGSAPSSVETHIRNLYRKLGANNRAAAIGYAFKRGLMKVSDL